ncbi:hypothetical protein [Achromobacter xylosoxidans]|uniref:hypothetical protein n=1 Tax=Alcaligenes xylosoxydans xylosoxydans TaxID=85698 RepID=UPI0038FD06F5
MTTKHTPGPWTVSDNHGKRYIEPVGDNEPVALICRGHADAYSANALLIAAAPELLKEAESAVRRLDWFLDANPDHVDSTLNVIRQDLRAAISKARGAQ